MRKVVSDSQVAHLWANKIQDEARTPGSGSFYFNGNTIYSYGNHFPIATHYHDKKLGDIVLFTLDTYSNTTAKHIGCTRSASSHLKKVYCLKPRSAAFGNHNENIEYWFKVFERQFKKLLTSKKPSIYTTAIMANVAQLNVYLGLFKKIKLTKEQKAVIRKIDKLQPAWQAQIEAQKEKEAKRLAEKQAKYAPDHEKYTEAWYNNQEVYLDADIRQNAYAYISLQGYNKVPTLLRFIPNEKIINSSLGVDVPVDIAHRFYKKYLDVIAAGGCEGESCKEWEILGYKVISATPELLKIGCHNLYRSEIDYIANKLNW